MNSDGVRRLTRAAACALFILAAFAGVFAQDTDTGSISGSTSPDTYVPRKVKPPSTPERRAAFSRKQFRKYADASRQKASKRSNLLFNNNVALLPSGEVSITSADNLSLSNLEAGYERELNFFADQKVFLLPDEFMQARFIEQRLKPRFANINVRALLEGLLLKGNSFKKTLTTTFAVPDADADSAVSKAAEILKSLK
jgi:hypothetical protein